MKLAAAAAFALILGACQPVPPAEGPSAERPEVPTTAEACRAAGGSWGRQGLLGTEQCVMPMPDAERSAATATTSSAIAAGIRKPGAPPPATP